MWLRCIIGFPYSSKRKNAPSNASKKPAPRLTRYYNIVMSMLSINASLSLWELSIWNRVGKELRNAMTVSLEPTQLCRRVTMLAVYSNRRCCRDRSLRLASRCKLHRIWSTKRRLCRKNRCKSNSKRGRDKRLRTSRLDKSRKMKLRIWNMGWKTDTSQSIRSEPMKSRSWRLVKSRKKFRGLAPRITKQNAWRKPRKTLLKGLKRHIFSSKTPYLKSRMYSRMKMSRLS